MNGLDKSFTIMIYNKKIVRLMEKRGELLLKRTSDIYPSLSAVCEYAVVCLCASRCHPVKCSFFVRFFFFCFFVVGEAMIHLHS